MTESTQEIEEQPTPQPAPIGPALAFEGTEEQLRAWFAGQVPVAGVIYGLLCTVALQGVTPEGKHVKRAELHHFGIEKMQVDRDVIKICGIEFHGDLFRQLGDALPLDTPFMVTKRADGVVTIQRVDLDAPTPPPTIP